MGLATLRVSQNVVPFFLAQIDKKNLTFLQSLLESRKVKPVIDRTYPLSEAGEAVGYLELGHARGKVVITV
jgi:NADPH:quinone reductase-like Zn-dependent oxidoreductase